MLFFSPWMLYRFQKVWNKKGKAINEKPSFEKHIQTYDCDLRYDAANSESSSTISIGAAAFGSALRGRITNAFKSSEGTARLKKHDRY